MPPEPSGAARASERAAADRVYYTLAASFSGYMPFGFARAPA